MDSPVPPVILIVDDDPLVRRILIAVLQRGGYQLLSAADARTALHVLDAGARPDLIISDITMPGMLGTELVQQLARRPALAAIPVILSSADHDQARIGKTAAFVGKPVAPEALLALVAELLAEANPRSNTLREPRRVGTGRGSR